MNKKNLANNVENLSTRKCVSDLYTNSIGQVDKQGTIPLFSRDYELLSIQRDERLSFSGHGLELNQFVSAQSLPHLEVKKLPKPFRF